MKYTITEETYRTIYTLVAIAKNGTEQDCDSTADYDEAMEWMEAGLTEEEKEEFDSLYIREDEEIVKIEKSLNRAELKSYYYED